MLCARHSRRDWHPILEQMPATQRASIAQPRHRDWTATARAKFKAQLSSLCYWNHCAFVPHISKWTKLDHLRIPSIIGPMMHFLWPSIYSMYSMYTHLDALRWRASGRGCIEMERKRQGPPAPRARTRRVTSPADGCGPPPDPHPHPLRPAQSCLRHSRQHSAFVAGSRPLLC